MAEKVRAREYTEDQIKKQFIGYLHHLVDYWENQKGRGSKDKLEGLVHSILVGIDGFSSDLPGFVLAPSPHRDDKKYCVENGKNYYPYNNESKIRGDIGGWLEHEYFSLEKASKKEYKKLTSRNLKKRTKD